MKKVKDDWQEVRLGDISYINSDILKKSDDYDYINYLDTGNITKGIIDNIQKIDISNIPSRAKRKVDIGDIIYSTVRPIQRHYGIIKKYIDNIIVSTGFITIKVKKDVADNYFIYYNITQDDIINYLQMIAEQSVSTYPSIKPSDLSDIKIKLPPLEEQKKIASILSSLDDKIELNNRTNKILEETAQPIFKEWFINFNFPNAKGKPYKNSGGKMIKSELGEISEGWEVTSLDKIVKVIKGKKPNETYFKKTDVLNTQYLTIDCYNNSNIEYTEYVEKMYVDKLDTIMVMDGASSGKLFYGKNGILSSTMAKFYIEDYHINEIIFFFLKKIENEIMYHTTGSAIPHASKQFILNKKIALPPEKLFSLTNCIKTIRENIITNIEENQKLASIRDSILPKLMSGEIRIK